jgi:2'-5' RNA ligase
MGTWTGLLPTPSDAKRIARNFSGDVVPSSELHVTLTFSNVDSDPEMLDKIVRSVTSELKGIEIGFAGVGRFTQTGNPELDPIFYIIDGEGVRGLRNALIEAFAREGVAFDT